MKARHVGRSIDQILIERIHTNKALDIRLVLYLPILRTTKPELTKAKLFPPTYLIGSEPLTLLMEGRSYATSPLQKTSAGASPMPGHSGVAAAL